ncbi:cytochrome P450 [Apiospora phragmitis]|uniref:Cytochrome P450 n=1 Tax=Apiospora phragmitis TaxID=2905665 RepID=A0ABR1T6X5_9PEZI
MSAVQTISTAVTPADPAQLIHGTKSEDSDASLNQDRKLTPLEVISYGSPILQGPPRHVSFAAERLHRLNHMAAAFRHWSREGYVFGFSGYSGGDSRYVYSHVHIYGHQAKVAKFKNYEVLSRQAANTLTLRDKAQHSRRRRVVSQAFSENSLPLFEPKILARIDTFCEMLRTKPREAFQDKTMEHSHAWTGPIDMSDEFNNLAFEIMTEVLFDMDFDTMSSVEYRYAMKAIEESNVRLGVLLQASELAIGFLDRRLFSQALRGRRQFVKFIRMVMAKRLGAPKGQSRDLFSHLQDCIDPVTGKGLSTETATFIVAGADTSSTSMAAVSHYITGSSHWYRKAAEEVRSTFPSAEDIRLGPKLNSCICLRACIDESLRLSPPGGSALWREVEAGGMTIAGDFVPEGSEVAVGFYSIQHSTNYYDRPFEFDASRWYRPVERVASDQQQSPYMPFSIGPRSCVEKPMAIAQITLVFARLLWEFDLRRASSPSDWENQDLSPTEGGTCLMRSSA